MRVGINSTCLNNRPSGARQRFLGIYGALFRKLSDVEFYLYEPIDCKVSDWFKSESNVVGVSTTIPSTGRVGKFLQGLNYWPEVFDKSSFDIFEAMHLPLVCDKNGLNFLTIHDIRGVYSENVFHRLLFSKLLRKALNKADHIITVSETMRQDILNFYSHTPVTVVYNGLDINVFDCLGYRDCLMFLDKYKLPRDYILSVGHFEPRKNYMRLIEAVALLKRRGNKYPLVIIGNDSGEREVLSQRIHALGLDNQVVLLTGLSDMEVRCAYKMAGLFVFPSLYEGFGIPILEAMAAQKPMVLSDLEVFREITQNKSVYFSPQNVEQMADVIDSILISRGHQQEMINYGNARVKDFSFEYLGNQIADIYKSFDR